MMKFTFKTSAESQAFCERVCFALRIFFGMTMEQAVEKVNTYWSDIDCIDDDPLLFHEPAYYYAMCIGHHPTIGDGNPNWETDPQWWPPPLEWTR